MGSCHFRSEKRVEPTQLAQSPGHWSFGIFSPLLQQSSRLGACAALRRFPFVSSLSVCLPVPPPLPFRARALSSLLQPRAAAAAVVAAAAAAAVVMADNAAAGLENHRFKSFKNKGRDVEVCAGLGQSLSVWWGSGRVLLSQPAGGLVALRPVVGPCRQTHRHTHRLRHLPAGPGLVPSAHLDRAGMGASGP